MVDRADVLNLEALDPDQIARASSANAAATHLAGGVSIQTGGVSIQNSNGQRISPGTIEPELQTMSPAPAVCSRHKDSRLSHASRVRETRGRGA